MLRIWNGDLKDDLVPIHPVMSRDTSHWIRLLKASSNLVFNTDRDGRSTISLGSLLSLTSPPVNKFFLIFNLNFPSFSLYAFSGFFWFWKIIFIWLECSASNFIVRVSNHNLSKQETAATPFESFAHREHGC